MTLQYLSIVSLLCPASSPVSGTMPFSTFLFRTTLHIVPEAGDDT
jgi:hypothetical protein